jgi:hypothetical protein
MKRSLEVTTTPRAAVGRVREILLDDEVDRRQHKAPLDGTPPRKVGA